MLRLTFVLENRIISLGIPAVSAFFTAMDTEEIDAWQEIDDDFINKLESMETDDFDSEVGFTEKFKARMIELLDFAVLLEKGESLRIK